MLDPKRDIVYADISYLARATKGKDAHIGEKYLVSGHSSSNRFYGGFRKNKIIVFQSKNHYFFGLILEDNKAGFDRMQFICDILLFGIREKEGECNTSIEEIIVFCYEESMKQGIIEELEIFN